MSIERTAARGLPKDYDDHGRKKQKTGSTEGTAIRLPVLRLPETATTTVVECSPLDTIDIASKVFPFLEARELLSFVSCRKDYRRQEYLTYPLVVRSALVTGGHAKSSTETLVRHLMRHLVKNDKIQSPDPLWILRWACKKGCGMQAWAFPSRDGFSPESNDQYFKAIPDRRRRVYLLRRRAYLLGEYGWDVLDNSYWDDMRDKCDQNSKAILDAFRENIRDAEERERWRVDRVLQRLADLLGDDHPCREHVLCHRDWDDLAHKYVFCNECVNATLACVLDLRNPGSITPEMLVEASRELKEHDDEYQRQLRIKQYLHVVAPELYGDWRLRAGWKYPEKRFVHYKEDIDKVLEPFLVNRDDHRQSAAIAQAMYDALKKAQINLD